MDRGALEHLGESLAGERVVGGPSREAILDRQLSARGPHCSELAGGTTAGLDHGHLLRAERVAQQRWALLVDAKQVGDEVDPCPTGLTSRPRRCRAWCRVSGRSGRAARADRGCRSSSGRRGRRPGTSRPRLNTSPGSESVISAFGDGLVGDLLDVAVEVVEHLLYRWSGRGPVPATGEVPSRCADAAADPAARAGA